MNTIDHRLRIFWYSLALLVALTTTAMLNGYVAISGYSDKVTFVVRAAMLVASAFAYCIYGFVLWYVAYLIASFKYGDAAASHFSEIYFYGLLIIGYVWVAAKLSYAVAEGLNQAQEKRREQEEAERERERAKQELDRNQREQCEAVQQHGFLTAQVAELALTCGPPAIEMIRLGRAWGGGGKNVNSPEKMVLLDVYRLLGTLAVASGGATRGLAMLYYAIEQTLATGKSRNIDDSQAFLNEYQGNAVLPPLVGFVVSYDRMHGSNLAERAASVYISVLQAGSDVCGASPVVQAVRAQYIALLSTYSRQEDSSGASHSRCAECEQAYTVLGLSGVPSNNDIKRAYHDLLKVWHTDRFSERDDRLKQRANDETVKLNLSYKHLRKCSERR